MATYDYSNRQQGVVNAGFNAYADSRQGSRSSGWTAGSISPGLLPMPPGFLAPEEIAKRSTPITPTKTFTPADFMTSSVPLNDPKLASRMFSGVPNAPISVGASIGVNQNIQVPAFLTNAVNQLNATQSLQASMQEGFRQQLLEAVLSGNYLAAEALRATGVSPGASVTFGQAVQNPQQGQAALVAAGAQATQAQAISNSLQGVPTQKERQLTMQLADVQQKLSAPTTNLINPNLGPDRAQLTQQQFAIQRELERLQQNVRKPTVVANSGFVSPSYF